MVDKQRTLHYKHAVLFQGGDLDLQALVRAAIDALPDVESREQDLITGGKTKLVLSGVGATNSMLTAKLMQYTAGQKQKFLEKDASTGDYKLDSISPPAAAGGVISRREFVESLLYLALFQSHVVYIGSQALRSKNLEDHLNWLLRTTGNLAAEDYLILKDQPSAKAMADISSHPVAAVEIGGELDFEVVEQVSAVRKSKNSARKEGYKLLKPTGDGATAIGAFLGDWFGDASLKTAIKRDEVIAFKLQLTYKNRKKSPEGFELMEKLAVAGRHYDIDDCRVRLHQGGVLQGEDLKLEGTITVGVNDSGVLEEPTVWVKINTWLRNAIGTKAVGQQ